MLPTLPTISDQAEQLIALGVHTVAGLTAPALRALAENQDGRPAVVVIHPDLAPASVLAPLLRIGGKAGFVVTDMTDVDEFTPIASVAVPDTPVYLVSAPERGDAMANWSPDEALPAILDAGRTPLTLTEGLHWLLQRPDALQRGRCFMTIGFPAPQARRFAGSAYSGAVDQQRHRA